MLFSSGIIALSDQKRIAEGSQRSVFTVAGQPDLLVKVATPDKIQPSHSLRLSKRIIRKLLPNTRFRVFLVEAKYEMDLAARLGALAPTSPLPKSLGVVSTDLGVGVVVEKIADDRGELAKTLDELYRRKQLTAAILEHLNIFAAKLFDMQIIAGNLSAGNIVLGRRNGKDALFLVDGFGERHAIPIRSWFRFLNNHSLNRRMEKMALELGLIWQADQRKFRFSDPPDQVDASHHLHLAANPATRHKEPS